MARKPNPADPDAKVIAKGDRRASGKIITFVGQTAELQTGDFAVKVLIVPHPTDRD